MNVGNDAIYMGEESTITWSEIYQKHLQADLDAIENNDSSYIIFWSLEVLLQEAINTNRLKCIELILDTFDVPRNNMNTKERITYYQLMSTNG